MKVLLQLSLGTMLSHAIRLAVTSVTANRWIKKSGRWFRKRLSNYLEMKILRKVNDKNCPLYHYNYLVVHRPQSEIS